MKKKEYSIKGLKLLTPDIKEDNRGFFVESYKKSLYESLNIPEFVQDNHSFSKRGVLRGLHFQKGSGQDKLVTVIHGKIFDVAVDIRKDSKTFGKWISCILDDVNQHQFFIPAGFAHGFCVLSEEAHVTYKVSTYYDPELEGAILWNDTDINIDWPIKDPILSDKDKNNPLLREIDINNTCVL